MGLRWLSRTRNTLEEAESRHPAGPALLVLAAEQLQALRAAAHLVGLDAEAELGGRPVVLLALRHVVYVGLGEVGEVLQVPGVLGRALGGVVEPRAAQGEVEPLPDLAAGLTQLQEALDFGAAPGVQEVLGGGQG